MPIEYDPPPEGKALVQGEIVAKVPEYRVLFSPEEEAGERTLPTRAFLHPRAVVLNAYCDLVFDYAERSGGELDADAEEEHHKLVPYVFLASAYGEENIKTARDYIGSSQWRRIQSNQDARYHHLRGGPIRGTKTQLPSLYLDFKKVFAVPTAFLYQCISSAQVGRVAVTPHPYREDLIQRYAAFVARVSVPNPWTPELMRRAYRESPDDSMRPILQYLADRPGEWIGTSELMGATKYKDRSKIAGVFGAFGRRCRNRYGMETWPMQTHRSHEHGEMEYLLQEELAEVVRDERDGTA